jgi:SAM-dependent methyltransferase
LHAVIRPLPLPPLEMGELIGAYDASGFDNSTGAPIWDDLPEEAWCCYLDFGCGCGRSARRLMQQTPRPDRYIGVDIHRGMVRWCQENLTPLEPTFEFHHHDVYSAGLNPDRTRPWARPLPVADSVCTIVEATSVFTHLVESQAEFYLDEMARVLAPTGVLISTWFLFDKTDFPFMQDNQNALYINDRDPTNAVVFDVPWLYAALAERELAIVRAEPPAVRGFHWRLHISPARAGVTPIELPPDTAPPGREPPPLLRVGAHRIGLDEDAAAGALNRSRRQELPPPDPLLHELESAKAYIASLESTLEATRRDHAELRSRASEQDEPHHPRPGTARRVAARVRRYAERLRQRR